MAQRPALPIAVRAAVWDKSGGVCYYCGKELHPFTTYSVDHAVAVVTGGTDDLTNLVAACRSCNARKRSLSADEFLRQPILKPSVDDSMSGKRVDGEKLKAARKRAALSMRDLAEASGVTLLTIHRLETGKVKDAFPSTLRKLAEALEVKPSDLMSEALEGESDQ